MVLEALFSSADTLGSFVFSLAATVIGLGIVGGLTLKAILYVKDFELSSLVKKNK